MAEKCWKKRNLSQMERILLEQGITNMKDLFALSANNSFQNGKSETTDKSKWGCAAVVNVSKKIHRWLLYFIKLKIVVCKKH